MFLPAGKQQLSTKTLNAKITMLSYVVFKIGRLVVVLGPGKLRMYLPLILVFCWSPSSIRRLLDILFPHMGRSVLDYVCLGIKNDFLHCLHLRGLASVALPC